MHIQFSLNAPPKARFATITTMCSFLTLPKSQNLYTVDEQVLRDLLNGKPTHVRVRTSPEDCAVKGLFNTPGALTLSLGGRYLRLRTKLLDSETCCHGPWKCHSGNVACELQLAHDIVEQAPPKGVPVIIGPYLRHQRSPLHNIKYTNENPLRSLKHLLNNPEKYYVSQNGFFIENPQSLEDYVRIYLCESNDSAPTAEEVLLDPLLYTNHENYLTAKFARQIISG